MAEPTLFDEASLALIASGGAGKDGKVYSIKPVPEYGPEKVTNVDFATDSDWSKTSGVTISGGKALLNIVGGAYTSLSQAFSYTSGRSYVLTAVVQGTSGSNGKQFRFQDRGNNTGGLTISNGTITLDESVQNIKIYWTANSNSDGLVISRASTGDWSFSIDNVSVKEVLVDAADFTFSRGSNLAATRVGPDGLIEKGRENLLLQSNQFDTTWVQSGATLTSGQSGYDGSSDAWLLTKNASFGRLDQTISSSGVQTYSVYAKANDSDWIYFRADYSGGVASGYFDLVNGVGGSFGNIIDSDITSVGGGWYRIQIVFNATTTIVRIYPAEDNNQSGGTSGSIYIQDSQLEIGLAATEVISSGASTGKAGLLEDEPRFDYSRGATCPSLLLEPSRTQLIGYSEYKASGNFTNSTPSYNAASSPEGFQNATEMFDNSTNGQHRVPIGSFSVTSGTNYTISAFVKNNDIGYCYLLLEGGFTQTRYYFNLSTGQAITSGLEVENFENGWYRIYVTQSAAASGTGSAYLNMSNNGVSPIYVGSNQSLYFYGFQAETASYPTSYIPNHSGGTITRGADVCGDAGDVNTFNSTEGVLYLEASALDNGSSEKGIALNDGGTNNRINIRILNNNIRAYGIVGGSLVCLMTYAAPSVTSINKIAFKYKENDFALWVNGVERVTDNSGAIFPANTLNELSFDYGGASAFFYGKVKQVLVFKEALSDTELVKLTTI